MNSKIKRVAEIIAEAILRKKISKVLVENIKKRKGIEMNKGNHLQEQLDSLNKMSLDELRDLCHKYYPGAKNCRSKMILRKKISFIVYFSVLKKHLFI